MAYTSGPESGGDGDARDCELNIIRQNQMRNDLLRIECSGAWSSQWLHRQVVAGLTALN